MASDEPAMLIKVPLAEARMWLGLHPDAPISLEMLVDFVERGPIHGMDARRYTVTELLYRMAKHQATLREPPHD